MIIKQNATYHKLDVYDYIIYIDKKNAKGIFTPYYKGSLNSFLYDFKLEICRTFHKDAKTYSIIDLSLDGKFLMTISVTNNNSQNNVFRIVEIGTNKIMLEISNMYVYDAAFTSNPRYIFISAKEFNIIKIFVYDIELKKIVLSLKENFFIKSGCFNEDRSIYIYPSENENRGVINYLNFNTLYKTKEIIEHKISKIFYIGRKGLLLYNYLYIYLYKSNKIIWEVNLESFIDNYKGDFFYMESDNKIYLDYPMVVQEKISKVNDNNIMFLYRIETELGNTEYIQLPNNIKYKKFTPMSDYKIIDTAGNISDLRNKTTSNFPLNIYR